MAGNAREWVADRYGKDYYATSPVIDPSGPEAGDLMVLRGGSWGNLPRYLRLSSRVWDDPGHRNDSAGLRCARDTSP
jgi:formylglycine-generating enzyme required for sulfatase activity